MIGTANRALDTEIVQLHHLQEKNTHNVVHTMNVIGKDCIIFDDMVVKADTLTKVANVLQQNVPISGRACYIYVVMYEPAIRRMKDS